MAVDFNKLLHPEKLQELTKVYPIFEKMWRETSSTDDFQTRVALYMSRAMAYITEQVASHPSLSKGHRRDIQANALHLGPLLPMIRHAQGELEEPYNWSEAAISDVFGIINSFMVNLLGCHPYTASLILRIWFTLNAWLRSQRQIYTVTPDLEWGLRNTELRGFRADNLRLPFPCVYVELPHDMEVWNEETGWHTGDGAYILEYESRGEYFSDGTQFGYEPGTRMWQIILAGKPKNKEYPLDDAVYYYRIGLEEGVSIESAVEKAVSIMSGEGDVSPDMKDTLAYEQMGERMFEAFRYVMNVMVYCTSKTSDRLFVDASPEYESLKQRMMKAKGKKRERLKKRLRKKEGRPRILVGGKLYTGNRLRQQEHDDGDVRPSNGRRVKVRHIVAGHWREQACGPGWKDRRTTFIEPHWRGPEHAPLTHKQREVK